jgi:peptidyl-prolyl cis-trans isomerase D
MLQSIRTKAGGIIVKVLFGLLILLFGYWGIYTRSPGSDDKSPDAVVASVGGHDIRADQVREALQPALERLRAQFGGTIEPAQAKQLGILDLILRQLIDRTLLDLEVSHLRLDLSDEVVRGTIFANPAFRGPDGQFNREMFGQVLAMNHLTEQGLVDRLRHDIPRGDLLQALTAGVILPPQLVDAIYRYRGEKRVADIVAIPLTAAGTIAQPTDAHLSKYYDAHPELFRTAEFRGFTMVSLGVADLLAGIEIPDAKLKAAYQERKDDFDLPEQRRVQQILAPTEEKAKAAAAALAAGKDWQEVATSIVGQDPGTIDLGLLKQVDLPKPIGDAVFGLDLNKPSEPIKDGFGWHIFRVVKIEPPQTATYDQAKEQLKTQLVQEAAADRLDHIANQLDDALAAPGSTLADVAAKFGLKTTTVAATDISGRDPEGKPVTLPVAGQYVLKIAFDTGQNETSRIIAVEDTAIFALHVDKVTAPSVKPLDQVKDQVTAAWQLEQRREAVKKIGDEMVAAVAAGTPLAKVTADRKLTLTTPPPLVRQPQQGAAVPPALLVKLFAAKIGDTVSAADNTGVYIGQLKEVQTPDSTPPEAAATLNTELGNAARYDFVAELTEALKKRFPVDIHHDVLDKSF